MIRITGPSTRFLSNGFAVAVISQDSTTRYRISLINVAEKKAVDIGAAFGTELDAIQYAYGRGYEEIKYVMGED